jgi:hypothetical protein
MADRAPDNPIYGAIDQEATTAVGGTEISMIPVPNPSDERAQLRSAGGLHLAAA